MSGRLWIVAPVFDDVESFLRLRTEILLMVGRSDLPSNDTAFIVSDDTAGRDTDIKSLGPLPDVTVVTPPFSLGHQGALVYALRSVSERIADDDFVVTLDADGEDRPRDIPALLEVIAGNDSAFTVALARRTSRNESVSFKLGYRCFKIVFKVLTGTVIRTGNFAAYRGRVIRLIDNHPSFDLSYSASLNAVGLNVNLIPCPRGQRYFGESRMNLQKLLLHGLSMLVPLTDRIALRAMAFFSAAFCASVLLGVAVVCIRFVSSSAIPGWATYALLSLAVASLISLGNFIVLFVVFSQSKSVSVGALDIGPRR
ncbi:MAG: glycosyltransferase [Solirubrobacterales bacterium]|nr:glycosyltransferase [Solirubrobacterales bacterium]